MKTTFTAFFVTIIIGFVLYGVVSFASKDFPAIPEHRATPTPAWKPYTPAELQAVKHDLAVMQRAQLKLGPVTWINGVLDGYVTNTSGADFRWVSISYDLFDKGGAKLDTARASIQGLRFLQVWHYKAYANPDATDAGHPILASDP